MLISSFSSMAQSPLGTSRHIAVTQQFGRFWRILLKKSAGVTWPIGCCAEGCGMFRLSDHLMVISSKGTVMDTILIIILLLILFGGLGGGYYGFSHYGTGGGIGILGVVLIVALVLFLFGRGRG